ncbi:hypothetical protein LTR95_014569 [Oleoguttula sp. CCFEE 5521]
MAQDFSGEPFPFIRGERHRVYEATISTVDHGDNPRLESPASMTVQTPSSADYNPAWHRRDHMYKRDRDDLSIVPGRLYQLGELDREHGMVNGVWDPDSILWKQDHINNKAGNHILMVWDTRVDEYSGRKVARCLQLTSFGDHERKYSADAQKHLTIEQKYTGKSWFYHLQYLAIEHRPMSNVPHNMPVLKFIEEDPLLDHQTYVHLDHFLEIDVEHLLPQRDGHRRELDDRSFCVLLHRLDRFVHKSWGNLQTRRGDGSSVASPLDPKTEKDGPQFSPWIVECSKHGLAIEKESFDRYGGLFWTGHEKWHNYVNPNRPYAWMPDGRPNNGTWPPKMPRRSKYGPRQHAGRSNSRGFNDPRQRMPNDHHKRPFN